jgi:SAM-dependent methyltransferase
MSTTALPVDDAALKERHRALWGLGDYPRVAAEVIPDLGRVLVESAGVGPGTRVLDVAAGSGNVAVPAALAGADVVASDLSPDLLLAGERAAGTAGGRITWRQADAEALPFADGEFDAVLSCVGVMFAPHHQAAVDELVRVARPGGTIGLVSWTPGGFVGQMFATMKPFVAPAPAGASPPPLWGDADYVAGLFGSRVGPLDVRTRNLEVDRFASPQEFLDYFKACYGPTIAAYRGLVDQPERAVALDQALIELAGRFTTRPGRMDWEYLLVTGTRRQPD